MRGRPNLYTDYKSEMGLFPTTTKKVSIVLLGVIAVLVPFNALPLFGFLGDSGWMVLINKSLIYAIGALGFPVPTVCLGS